MKKQGTTIGLIGARGYSGRELVRLLLGHPNANLQACFGTQDFSWSEIKPFDRLSADIPCLRIESLLENPLETYFLATPAEVSLELTPKLLATGARVIDLSGAYRLHQHDYKTWYGFSHHDPKGLSLAHYGLQPFAGPSSSRLVANPGCYATAALMALVPLLKNDLIETNTLILDGKSGASGAGKKAAENLLFSEVTGDCLPYRIGRHQHLPEIIEVAQALGGKAIDPHFSTHLMAVDRGLSVALYARTKSGTTAEHIQNAFSEAYKEAPLVRFARNDTQLMKLRHVAGTPFTHISYELVGDKLFVFSAIDNLLKGAASQAIENFNLMWDLPATTGLLGEAR